MFKSILHLKNALRLFHPFLRWAVLNGTHIFQAEPTNNFNTLFTQQRPMSR